MRLPRATVWTSATVGVLLAASLALPPLAYADEGEHRNDEEIIVLAEGSGDHDASGEDCTQEASLTGIYSFETETGYGTGNTIEAAVNAALAQIAVKVNIKGPGSTTQCGTGHYTWYRNGTGSGNKIYYTVYLTQPCTTYNALPGQSPVLPASMKV